jgi:hypothetical protein
MMSYRTLSWSDVVSFYQKLIQTHALPIIPMLDLVTFIAASPYAAGLFPVTSHATLRLGHYPNFLAGDGELDIDFDQPTQTFIFVYWSHPSDVHQWTRRYSVAESRDALERFLHTYARWFRHHKGSSNESSR